MSEKPKDHPDVAKYGDAPFPVVYHGPVDLHVPDEEFTEWEADRARALERDAQVRELSNYPAATFMAMLRSTHGEEAPRTHLCGMWDPALQAWRLKCPHCDGEDEMHRPLIVARNGHVACQGGCDFTAILSGILKLRRRAP